MREETDVEHGPAGDEGILDSWKEISAYLGRAVRTAQTWEKEEGLPIHRHQHTRAPTVFAYTSEIDAWLKTRSVSSLDLTADVSAGPSRRARRLAGGLLVFAAMAGAAWLAPLGPRATAPELAELPASRIWVIVADFDNRTGESLLDGTLNAALVGGIANSRDLVVAPPGRIADTLQLMAREADSPLDRALAREVALRDGGIRAVLVGTVDRLDSTYRVNLEVVETSSGVTMAWLSEQAPDLEGLLPAVSRLSSGVREVLGERPPESGNSSLERVSTRSLAALQAYSRAVELMLNANLGGPRRDDAAEVLLRDAIAEDPAFASAHLMLGWALFRQGRPFEEFIEPMNRALSLVEGASEREALFIRASHAHMNRDIEVAAANYLALVEAHPDHFWGQYNVGGFLYATGRRADALEVQRRYAATRPNNFGLQASLAFVTLDEEGFVASRSVVEHALSLASPERLSRPDLLRRYARLEGILSWEPWLEGDLDAMVDEVDRLELAIDQAPVGEWRQSLIWRAQRIEVALGRLRRAAAWTELRAPDDARLLDLALLHYARDDLGSLMPYVEELVRSQEPDTYLPPIVPDLLAMGGRSELAERVLADFRIVDTRAPSRGHIALARGRYQEAIAEFSEGLSTMFGHDTRYFLAAQGLARAYTATGELGQARAVLEDASGFRSQTLYSFSAAAWLRHQRVLASFYRERGMDELAAPVESELRELLALADADHPMLAGLAGVRPRSRVARHDRR